MSRIHALFWFLSTLGAVLVIGRIKIGKALQALQSDIVFAHHYRNNLILFSNTLFNQQSFNNDLYNWLTLNVAKMQISLGQFGKIDLKPAGENYVMRNYQLLVNTLAEMRSAFADSFTYRLMGKAQDAANCSDMILRYSGSLLEQEKPLRQRVRNPFAWLQEGTQFIITFPISLLYWSGLIQYSALTGWSQSFFVKFLSFTINLIGLVGSIITIVTGWNPFMVIYHHWR